MAEDGEKIVPFLSKPYADQIPQLGHGRKLFEQIDEAQHDEEISPQLAEAMRKALTAKGISEEGSLENLALKGGVKYAITQFEGMLQSAGRAMQKHGEGNEGEIMVEWLNWVNKE